MFQTKDILEGARSIRPHLTRLLGEEGDSVDSELAQLLKQAQDGHQVDTLILRVLARRDPTREWLAEYLKGKHSQEEEDSQTKSYEPLAGLISALPSSRYQCPQGDYEWYQRSAGIPVPECPINHIPLVQVEQTIGRNNADEFDGRPRQ